MKPHYYYKAKADTQVGCLLQDYTQRCADASEQARIWAESHGADFYYESPNSMAGGIIAVEFQNTLSKEGWQRVETPTKEVYFVPNPDSELEKEMWALPVVSEFELVSILRFRPVINKKTGKPHAYSFGNTTPVVFLSLGHWYVDVPYECQEPSLVKVSKLEFDTRRSFQIDNR